MYSMFLLKSSPFQGLESSCWSLHVVFAGLPGEKPQVTSDKLPDSPSKFPCIQL